MNRLLTSLFLILSISYQVPMFAQVISEPTSIGLKPFTTKYKVKGALQKKVSINLTTEADYATLSLMADAVLLVDNIDIPTQGEHNLNAIVQFEAKGKTTLKLIAKNGAVTINKLSFSDVPRINIPVFADISEEAGLQSKHTYKYGGPTVADINNDGYYDFILNNHHIVPAQLIWNNGDGTVQEYFEPIARWDLHGSAAGDIDNDGDLDLIITQGGGNGKTPNPPNILRNENGRFVLVTFDAGITKGARGRAGRWVDMDLDGDLDLIMINAKGIENNTLPQHLFYKNKGNGTFTQQRIKDLEFAPAERILITDFNRDNIDDLVLFEPLSIWKGDGKFGFTDVTKQILPPKFQQLKHIYTVADIDIDNDGDLDLYLARGKSYLESEYPCLDFDPLTKRFDLRSMGKAGVTQLDFVADGAIRFFGFDRVNRGYKGKYPVFLGAEAKEMNVTGEDTVVITPKAAKGIATDRTRNGIYIAHIGNGKWKMEWMRKRHILWSVSFSIEGIQEVNMPWQPQNRNEQDYLLRNDGGIFTDVSEKWNIPIGGKTMGVTTGDFNNDGLADLFIYRYGNLHGRVADYLLTNTGSRFEITTQHTAHDPNEKAHGDMGQAFDFDLDGDVDLLNGSDEMGKWYLYANQKNDANNYTLLYVGYAPESNIDPISATVEVFTPKQNYFRRIGSAGASFSQSLLNTVHFGLGKTAQVDSIVVRWRNGETVVLRNPPLNQRISTDSVEPNNLTIHPSTMELRENATFQLRTVLQPSNANRKVSWRSSDESIVSVDSSGIVTGYKIGKSAFLIATSVSGKQIDTCMVKVVKWFPKPIDSIRVIPQQNNLIAGDSLRLQVVTYPEDADQQAFSFKSKQKEVLEIKGNKVKALKEGTATVEVQSANGKSGTCSFDVAKYTEPTIAFVSDSLHLNSNFMVGDTLAVKCRYDAGAGHKVISSNLGGMKIWLREVTATWGNVKDYVFSDGSVIGTQSGIVTAKLPLHGVTPTAELAEGNFYYLWVTFTSSNGQMQYLKHFPINIIPAENKPGK